MKRTFKMPSIRPYRCLLISLGLILGMATAGRAQDSGAGKPVPPPPPYVGRLTGDFTFIKKLVYKPQPPKIAPTTAASPEETPSGPDLKELDAVKVGGWRRDKQSFVDNTNSEIWRCKNVRFLLSSSDPSNILVIFPLITGYKDVPDFQEVEWVGADSFQGEEDYQGKTCYVYKSGDQTAYIDKATTLPVYLESGSRQVSYSYAPPPQNLQMPPNFEKRFQQVQRAWTGQAR